MRNHNFWVCLLIVSMLLINLAGCQKHDAPDPGSSQPSQSTAPAIGTTQAPDEITQAPTTLEETEASADANWIRGFWTTVARGDEMGNGEVVSFVTKVTYGFNADGTGSINEYGWMSSPGGKWEVAGMGFVETYFTYTLEGNTLTIIHTGSEFEVYPENERYICVYDVVRNGDGSVTWMPEGGGEDRVYRKAEDDLSVEELLRLFGLDPNVPKN